MSAIFQLLFKFWPILIPFILYFIWLRLARVKAKDGKKPKFGEGPFKWAVYSALGLMVLMLVYLFFFVGGYKDDEYIRKWEPDVIREEVR